ncbi:hypothetical protein EJ03DRAFT_305300 [Teratosphaeria nubilosa]|uniref:Heterokaryon incompatibility domain-containing protein n=1 Tax=Teratosphaeria nubilosa TaxID=161662 RepID=A0A6G1LNI0_9PEZI|nr:hypothetical protein EJ03DRAFT_305300 [Teratosphaeria nubilosa]
MRLLDVQSFEMRSFHDDAELPQYAILSHTWREDGEPEFSNVLELSKWSWSRTKTLYRKVSAAAHLARKDGLQWIWIDTCCIDRGNLVKVQEAVNASFRWYQEAEICYVYLEDLDTHAQWMESFSNCTWFSRGWTLSELLAPRKTRSYNNVWRHVGTKAMLARVIARITGIDAAIIRQRRALSSVSAAARLSWAAKRKTRRVEDQAHCLLGIFGISMPILYGEGPRAFHRLQEELINTSGDLSIFAWSSSRTGDCLLARSPDSFAECGDVILSGTGAACDIRNSRLKATLPIIQQNGGLMM